ncbi:MAG: ligase-associated DNA damage response endonuclease PdeM, partial [Deltaproteobacteria bacterium]
MNSYDFTLAEQALTALCGGGLYWKDKGLLVVADLHLGKALRLTRQGGGLLPPWEAVDTLERLDGMIRDTDPSTVTCLGDSFDDLQAADDIEENARLWLLRLMAGRRWLWVEGNHDPGPLSLPGEHHFEVRIGPLTFRHIAQTTEQYEISAHYHPKASIRAKGASLTRPCFLI